jgi:Tol biopolymer transport system component
MYIRSLSIQNLRSFESEELPLCYPGQELTPATGNVPHLDNITLLLGSNGAGKTTVLRAAALSTLAPVLAMGSGYVPYALVRRVRGRPTGEGRAEARVVLHAQDGQKEGEEAEVKATLVAPTRGYTDRFVIDTHPPRWQVRLYEEEESPAFLVLGYGSTRRVETGPGSVEGWAKERVLRYRRVAGLFEEHMTLMPLSTWLPRVKDRKRQHEVVELMNQLLPDTKMLAKWEDTENPEALFRRGGSVLPYPALSDGYRAFICWVGDLLYHLNMICPKGKQLVEMRGVVLVDEVDLHLHPEWQRHLVPSMSRTLPRLQFILTSHSPIVVGTLSSQNVLLLTEQEKPGGVRVTHVRRPGEELYGLSADQILTSDSFGLESSRDERFFEQLKEAAGKAREGGAEDALRFMRMVAGGAVAEGAPTYTAPQHTPLVLRVSEEVWGVEWSPDGRRLASASDNGAVLLWDAQTGQQQALLRGHEAVVWVVAWSPDGRRLASASSDGTVRLWDVQTGQQQALLQGPEGSVDSIAWSPDGRRLASTSDDGTVRLWDVQTGQQQALLRGHDGAAVTVMWSPEGKRVASGASDRAVLLWDVQTGQQQALLRGHDGAVWSIAWSPDGRRLASASSDHTLRLWDVQTGQQQALLRGHDGAVYSVAWSPDGRRVASASEDRTVRLWDVQTGQQQALLRGHEDAVNFVAWSPDGRRLASASSDHTLRLWVAHPEQPETFPGVRSKPPSLPASDTKQSVQHPTAKAPKKRASPQRKAPRRQRRE